MKKYLPYIFPILVIIIFLIGITACDNSAVPKPDIRKEFKNEKKKPDYFGIKWNFKW